MPLSVGHHQHRDVSRATPPLPIDAIVRADPNESIVRQPCLERRKDDGRPHLRSAIQANHADTTHTGIEREGDRTIDEHGTKVGQDRHIP
jgi:hypothetical protein